MRKVPALALGLAVVLASPIAAAQDTGQSQAQPFNLQREQLGSYAAIDAARARARRGDCPGALPLFDQAISTIDDPTLDRDRGLCHDALHDVYPAIDDYRAYLYRMPDAPDADDIRARLDRLEAQVGAGGATPYTKEERHRASLSVGSTAEKYDSVQDEEADTKGPLRSGKGWVLAPIIGLRNWFSSNLAQSSVAENIGARLAWVVGEMSSFLLEVGYERWNTSAAESISLSGLTTQLGYEARLPFNRDTNLDNLVILGLGVGYEHLVFNYGTVAGGSTVPDIGGIGPRARAGYRHNFSKKAALEATLDGGFADFFTYGSGSTSATSVTPWMGLNVGLLFGI